MEMDITVGDVTKRLPVYIVSTPRIGMLNSFNGLLGTAALERFGFRLLGPDGVDLLPRSGVRPLSPKDEVVSIMSRLIEICGAT